MPLPRAGTSPETTVAQALAAAGSRGTPGAPALAAGAGVLLMGTTMKVAAAAVVLLGAGAWWIATRDTDATKPSALSGRPADATSAGLASAPRPAAVPAGRAH